MNINDNAFYKLDLEYVSEIDVEWEKLKDKNILISGATGLVGSFLIDLLMSKNKKGLGCKLYAITRNKDKAVERFNCWKDDDLFNIIEHDINTELILDDVSTVDYVLHMASNTHPLLYSTDPIGTIMTNVVGLTNMLDFAVAHKAERFAFASSNEIYGENRGDKELFDEEYCGYINCNTMRAGYPESKRCGEALCQAYKAQKGLNIVIPRLTRSYGPTMKIDDTKAISQFIRNGVNRQNIVLKSTGEQFYSYTYVADAVSGLLYVLLKGENGAAYNISDEKSDIKLKDLASIIADISHKKVVFEIPDSIESAGYSKATKARLDSSKLKQLGWKSK